MVKIYYLNKENIVEELWISDYTKKVFGLSAGQYVPREKIKTINRVNNWIERTRRLFKRGS